MAIAVTHATMLNVSVFTCSPIRSLRFTSSRMKMITIGSQMPFPTCEKMKIFQRGTCGIRMMPAPTAIKSVYRP